MTNRSPESRQVESVGELLDELDREGLLDAESRGAVERAAEDLASGVSDDPWYLQGLAGVGAWLAAALVVASLSCSGLIELSGAYPFIWGPVFLAIGVGAHFVGDESNVFAGQLALAGTLIGEGLLVAGLYEQQGLFWTTTLFSGLVVAMYPWFSLDAHRFVSGFVALSLAAALVEDLGSGRAYTVLFAFEMAALCVPFSEGRIVPTRIKLALRPFGFAVAVSLLWLSSELYMREFVGVSTTWPYSVVAAIALVYLVGQFASRISDSPGMALVWGGAAAAGLAAISTPAVLVAFAVILAGASRRATALIVLGAASLIYNVGTFYYAIPLTVHAKALALVGSGVVLLLFAWGLRRWGPAAAAGVES